MTRERVNTDRIKKIVVLTHLLQYQQLRYKQWLGLGTGFPFIVLFQIHVPMAPDLLQLLIMVYNVLFPLPTNYLSVFNHFVGLASDVSVASKTSWNFFFNQILSITALLRNLKL